MIVSVYLLPKDFWQEAYYGKTGNLMQSIKAATKLLKNLDLVGIRKNRKTKPASDASIKLNQDVWLEICAHTDSLRDLQSLACTSRTLAQIVGPVVDKHTAQEKIPKLVQKLLLLNTENTSSRRRRSQANSIEETDLKEQIQKNGRHLKNLYLGISAEKHPLFTFDLELQPKQIEHYHFIMNHCSNIKSLTIYNFGISFAFTSSLVTKNFAQLGHLNIRNHFFEAPFFEKMTERGVTNLRSLTVQFLCLDKTDEPVFANFIAAQTHLERLCVYLNEKISHDPQQPSQNNFIFFAQLGHPSLRELRIYADSYEAFAANINEQKFPSLQRVKFKTYSETP